MIRRPVRIFLMLCACLGWAACALAGVKPPPSQMPANGMPMARSGPSAQAQELRRNGGLVSYAPARELTGAYFTADGNQPTRVYGPVSAYAKTRACPSAWLIEKGELARLSAEKGVPSFEYSVTLEEDCKGKVTHTVFVLSPGSTPEAWLKWRGQFRGGLAEDRHGRALAGLKKAEAAGVAPRAELRFVSVNGEPLTGSLEQMLKDEGRLAPVFDLDKGVRPGK